MNNEHENRTNGPRPGTDVQPTPPTPPTPPSVANNDFIADLLKRLDTIVNNNGYISDTVNAIRQMAESGEIDDESMVDHYVGGLTMIVTTREATNQKAIELIRDMYEGAKTTRKGVSGANIAENAIALGLDINTLIMSMEPERALIFTRELLGM